MGEHCSYTLDVEGYHEELSERWAGHDPTPLSDLPTDDGEWRCPRPAPDSDHCVLHDADATDEAVTAAVERALAGGVDTGALRPPVEDPQVAAKRFVGLTADTLDLSRRRVSTADTAAIDLRRAEVGTVRLAGTHLPVPLYLDGAELGRLVAPGLSTEADLRCRHATVGSVTVAGADVDGRLDLRFATVEGPVDAEGVDAAGRLDLGFATVTGPVEAERANCRGRFTMKEAEAASVAARHLSVGGTDPDSSYPGVQVRGLETDGAVDLRDCRCDGIVIGYAVEIGGDLDLSGAVVTDGVSMGGGTTDLREAVVEGAIDCSDATVRDAFKLQGRDGYDTNPEIDRGVDCSGAEIDRVEFAPELTTEAASVVDLRGATVRGGTLGQPTGAEPVVYDLQRATVGDVTIATGERSAAELVRFDRTALEGFRFDESRGDFADRDWRIHEVPPSVRRRIAVGRQYGRAAELAADLATVCAVQPRTREWLRTAEPPYEPATLAAVVLEPLDDTQRERVARNGPETADLLGERVFERERYREGVVTYLAKELQGQETPLGTVLDGAGERVAALAEATDGGTDERRRTEQERVATAVARTLADEHPVRRRPDRAETTYVMARRGADEVGDTTVAGELFVNELRARRRRHRERLRTADGLGRLRPASRYAANALFDVVAVYGEHPRRVFGVSAATVIGMAGLYWLAWLALPGFDATTYGGPDGALLLSLESFTSLVLGGAEAVEPYPVRLLVNVESFLGAFLVALFVFALTRSLKR